MQLKSIVVLTSLLTTIALSGCTLHKITDKQEICANAKRQEIFNGTNPSSTTANNLTNGQQAALKTASEC